MQPASTLNSMMVRIEHQRGGSIGLLMSDMRVWLDHQGIQPMGFKPITLPFGTIAFDVEFRLANQAALFRAAFAE
jgi:hypothetical protein